LCVRENTRYKIQINTLTLALTLTLTGPNYTEV
jgi:hypothetical protein